MSELAAIMRRIEDRLGGLAADVSELAKKAERPAPPSPDRTEAADPPTGMELTCFRYPGWRQEMRPAPPNRAWMDASPQQFAYRCLPLAIANGLGWEVLARTGATAIWNGGDQREDVMVRPDGPEAPPVALFGMGTLTFHIEGLFRTPPGWDLLVTGPLNRAKDGIAPLSAVVETAWSPYSFTMNWRFTRRSHWVRFEAGEPICCIIPLPTANLEAFEPRFAGIEAAPELKEQFEAWSRSRLEFQRSQVEHPAERPADTWQKRYYRGIDMDGREQTVHRTKLRMRPFVETA